MHRKNEQQHHSQKVNYFQDTTRTVQVLVATPLHQVHYQIHSYYSLFQYLELVFEAEANGRDKQITAAL